MNDEEKPVNPLDRPEWTRTRGALSPDEVSDRVIVSAQDTNAADPGAAVTSESCLSEHVREARRRGGLRAAIVALKEHWAARQASHPRPRMIVDPHPPIYDEAYREFTRMLDADNETHVGPPGSPTVSLAKEIAHGVERPLYGEVGAPFDLASVHAILARTEHEPPSQASNDTLWISLRLACEEVARLTAAIGRMAREFVDQTD